ncbi:MAG TPA: hypothetical protein VFR68_07985 [Candidatus Dormibacteraeota bacterium]|nr:hypothetical protein [Candidatus Dormibacteraeota bacterium]
MLAADPIFGHPQPPRPIGLPELLDRTFQAYRRNFWFFATIAIVCVVPDLFVEAIWGSGGLLGGARLLFAPYALGLLYISATQVVIWEEASLKDVLRAAFLRYFSFAWTLFAYVLCLLSLFIPPLGIWLFVRWMLAPAAVAAEPIGANAAVRRSAALVKSSWWRCFLTIATVLILTSLVAMILGLSVGVAAVFIPNLPLDIGVMVVGSAAVLAGSLAIPLVPIAFTLLYVDLRVRKEGFDLDYLARSAAEAA